MKQPSRRWWLSLAVAAVVLNVGCVERRMTIRSVPANALVVLDGQEIGFTPCSIPFDYYGTRQVKLVKDGYETRTINQTIATPWYEYIGLDFVSEVLIPWRIRDDRNYVYDLEPVMMVPNDQLLERAAHLRQEGRNPPADVLKRAGLPNTGTSVSSKEPLEPAKDSNESPVPAETAPPPKDLGPLPN